MCTSHPSIARFCRLITEFGVHKGVGIWWKLFRGDPLVKVPLSGSHKHQSEELYLRGRSSDSSVYLQVVLDDIYRDFRASLPNTSVQVIVDAGAHIGCASLMFHRTFPSARIIAIEPNRENFQLLSKNVSHYKNITCINAALWSSDGHLCISNDSISSTWGFITSPIDEAAGGNQELVNARSLPSIMHEFGVEKIDLLKVDIEGAERQIFGEGIGEWLPKVRSVVVEVHERMYPGCAEIVSNALQGFPGTVELLHE